MQWNVRSGGFCTGGFCVRVCCRCKESSVRGIIVNGNTFLLRLLLLMLLLLLLLFCLVLTYEFICKAIVAMFNVAKKM